MKKVFFTFSLLLFALASFATITTLQENNPGHFETTIEEVATNQMIVLTDQELIEISGDALCDHYVYVGSFVSASGSIAHIYAYAYTTPC